MRLFGVVQIPSFRRIFGAKWLRIPLMILGIVALCAAVWFGFVMTGVAVMATVWLRASVIGAFLFTLMLIWFLRWRKRRRAARALEDSLIPEPVGDGAVLSERMQEALEKLRKSGGKTYLYDLPWYIVIGPPGAGKTTALRNAGIEFPGSGDLAAAVEGFGGTRNCDWWFAEDAVLIDTAGRYVTQDSDAEADKASWDAFLSLLKKGRPNQPINGVILAFSIEDMMTATPETLDAHAETVRARLGEVHETLKIDFPVYMLFTKADLVAGFREYFGSFTANRRKAVWGATFQTRDRTAQTWGQVPAEIDGLVSRLSAEVIDRMAEEPDSVSRIAIFGLPGQVAMLRDTISEFMRKVFEPTRYKTNAILRGFYFTSGTQEGTPIDQVLGAMAETQGEVAAFQPSFMSGKGKSYFLHDLLKKVIFEESDWVSHDERAVRRAMILRGTALTLITVMAVGAMSAFGYSFWRNATLLNDVEAESRAYFGNNQTVINASLIDDTDPTPVMRGLQEIRQITAGYDDDSAPTFWEGMGLSQYRTVNLANERAYWDALERMLRPRMILHIEEELLQLIAENRVADVYRALKVYIYLGRQQQGPADDAIIQTYFEDVWRREFPGSALFDEREQLNNHLAAMLELDDGRESVHVTIDPELVRRAQEVIANLPLAEQAYSAIKDLAAQSDVPDFNLVNDIGGQVDVVFQTSDGSDLAEVGVPGLFTFEGYWGVFIEEVGNAQERLEQDRAIFGDVAGDVDYSAQLGNLSRDLHQAYRTEFQDEWQALFDRIELTQQAVDAPNYGVLDVTSSPTASPILRLVEAVEDQTRLARLYDLTENLTVADLAGGTVGADLGDAVLNRIYSRSGVFERVVIDAVGNAAGGDDKAPERAGGNALDEDIDRRRAEDVAEPFEDWYLLLRGEAGQRPIDQILRNLRNLRDHQRTAANAPLSTDDAALGQLLNALTSNNSSFPTPVAAMLNQVDREFRAVEQDATMAELNRALNDEVTQFCQQNVEPLFPFGTGRDIAPRVFGEFFGPNGRMDSFYVNFLRAHVTRTPDGLVPVQGSAVGERLSRGALRQFERAEGIRLAFFGSGTQDAEVGMFVTHQSSSPSVEIAFLTMNGSQVRTRRGDNPGALVWPGEAAGVSIELFPGDGLRRFGDGRWAIVQFLREGQGRPSGNEVTVTQDVGGRSITYKLEFDSTTVPFLMPELSEFSCPTSLE